MSINKRLTIAVECLLILIVKIQISYNRYKIEVRKQKMDGLN